VYYPEYFIHLVIELKNMTTTNGSWKGAWSEELS